MYRDENEDLKDAINKELEEYLKPISAANKNLMYKDSLHKNSIEEISEEKNTKHVKKSKNSNKKNLKITSIFLASLLAVTGTVSIYVLKNNQKYKLDRNNPFSGMDLESNLSLDDKSQLAYQFVLDNETKDCIRKIQNSSIEEKKAYALYCIILENEYLTLEEKKSLSGYIQYFIDNKYLDYDYISQKFSTLWIKENDSSLLSEGIAGYYDNDYNNITFATNEEREYTFAHEIFHSEDKLVNSLEDCGWLVEGSTCMMNYEYLDSEVDEENTKASFVRALCEIVDPEVFFKVRSTGNIEDLKLAMEEKGINRNDINKLFDLFNEFNYASFEDYQTQDELRKEILNLLGSVYIQANPNDDVDPIFLEHLKAIAGDVGNYSSKKFYFNSYKKEEYNAINSAYYNSGEIITNEYLNNFIENLIYDINQYYTYA